MRRAASAGIWGLLFFLGTGCATIIREAVQRDIDANKNLQGKEAIAGEADEPFQDCPPGKIYVEDCRVTPCKVTCEDPKEQGR